MRYYLYLDKDKKILSVFASEILMDLPYIDSDKLPNVHVGYDYFINGKIVRKTAEYNRVKAIEEDQVVIRSLKQKLSDTDYLAIKFAEGELTEEEFAPIKAQRQEWRTQIRALEAKHSA